LNSAALIPSFFLLLHFSDALSFVGIRLPLGGWCLLTCSPPGFPAVMCTLKRDGPASYSPSLWKCPLFLLSWIIPHGLTCPCPPFFFSDLSHHFCVVLFNPPTLLFQDLNHVRFCPFGGKDPRIVDPHFPFPDWFLFLVVRQLKFNSAVLSNAP